MAEEDATEPQFGSSSSDDSDADAHIEKEQLQETFESPPARRGDTIREMEESSEDMEQ
jgi:hypothetical protein